MSWHIPSRGELENLTRAQLLDLQREIVAEISRRLLVQEDEDVQNRRNADQKDRGKIGW